MSRDTPTRALARRALADAIRAKGSAWAGTADSLAAGNWGNVWTEAALDALEATTRNPLDGDDDD